MTEENQTPVPENAPKELPKVEETQKPKQKRIRRGILETLPDDVRKELDDYIRTRSPGAAFTMLKQKYTGRFPTLLKLSKTSVYRYTERYSLGKSNMNELLSDGTPIKEAINKTTDPNMSVFDKRAALINACELIDARVKTLMAAAAKSSFNDPRNEDTITHAQRLHLDVLKLMADAQDKQAEEANSNWLQEALTLEQMFINQAASVYREVHQDKKYLEEFMNKYIIRLEDMMKNYRASKEEFLKGKNKGINKT